MRLYAADTLSQYPGQGLCNFFRDEPMKHGAKNIFGEFASGRVRVLRGLMPYIGLYVGDGKRRDDQRFRDMVQQTVQMRVGGRNKIGKR